MNREQRSFSDLCRAHNPKVAGSNPATATNEKPGLFGRVSFDMGNTDSERSSGVVIDIALYIVRVSS